MLALTPPFNLSHRTKEIGSYSLRWGGFLTTARSDKLKKRALWTSGFLLNENHTSM